MYFRKKVYVWRTWDHKWVLEIVKRHFTNFIVRIHDGYLVLNDFVSSFPITGVNFRILMNTVF